MSGVLEEQTTLIPLCLFMSNFILVFCYYSIDIKVDQVLYQSHRELKFSSPIHSRIRLYATNSKNISVILSDSA